MWVIGLIGMSTSFFECTLAQVFKNNEPDGTYRGGPAYYMVRGAKKRWLAAVYSVLLLLTFGMAFVGLQSFTAASSLEDAFGIPALWTGIGLTAVVGAAIFGGVKRIASVTEVIVPLMAVSYIVIAVVVVLLNLDRVPGALSIIFKGAFGLDEAIGGGIGAAIMMGARRGLFSNEAGLGSGPNVAAVAWVPHPVNQGIVQMLSVFIDTAIICSSTAFIIIMSDVYIVDGANAVDGVVMTQAALQDHVGAWGRGFVSVALMLFAFTEFLTRYFVSGCFFKMSIASGLARAYVSTRIVARIPPRRTLSTPWSFIRSINRDSTRSSNACVSWSSSSNRILVLVAWM